MEGNILVWHNWPRSGLLTYPIGKGTVYPSNEFGRKLWMYEAYPTLQWESAWVILAVKPLALQIRPDWEIDLSRSRSLLLPYNWILLFNNFKSHIADILVSTFMTICFYPILVANFTILDWWKTFQNFLCATKFRLIENLPQYILHPASPIVNILHNHTAIVRNRKLTLL